MRLVSSSGMGVFGVEVVSPQGRQETTLKTGTAGEKRPSERKLAKHPQWEGLELDRP